MKQIHIYNKNLNIQKHKNNDSTTTKQNVLVYEDWGGLKISKENL